MPRRKITAGDWLRGAGRSVLSGQGMNPLATQRLVNQAHDERVAREGYPAPTRKGGYYSQMRADGTIDVFVGPSGDITAERPHVHVVHSQREARIVLTVTHSDGTHEPSEYLPADASGNEVEAAVDRLRRRLR